MEIKHEIAKEQADLQITLFGKFLLTYKGSQVKLGMSDHSIGIQILEFLICNAPKGFTEKELINVICDIDGNTSVNSIRVLISRVRKALSNAGIPSKTSIIGIDGKFYWQTSVSCYVDAVEFATAANLALKCKSSVRVDWLEYACKLYLGEFLLNQQDIPWIMWFCVYYTNLYSRCLQAFIDECEKAKQWERLLSTISNADHDENYHEWIIAAHIKALIHLGKHDAARQVYRKAVNRIRQDFGVQPSDLLLDCAKELAECEQGNSLRKQEFYKNLKLEANSQEGVYIKKAEFSVMYRVLFQQAKLLGITNTLVECRVTNRDGGAVRVTKLAPEAYNRAHSLIARHLRGCEVFTEIQQGIYLLLLCNTTRNETAERLKRLSAEYRKQPIRGFHLTFEYIHNCTSEL